MSINTAVITAAGLGTRMIPYSKEVPKEMLPVIVKKAGETLVLPALHVIFEALHAAGIRKYIIITGRGKRLIENYFTPDWSFVQHLRRTGRSRQAQLLEDFYQKLEESRIAMINQPHPRGFGDAVLRAADFTGETFIVHAGDVITHPSHTANIQKLLSHWTANRPAAALLYDEPQHPEKYGVIIGQDKGSHIKVEKILEKPRKPPTNKAVVAIYAFTTAIFKALEQTRPEKGEHQLTDAINKLIEQGHGVHAIKLQGKRLDLGTPKNYVQALQYLTASPL